MYPDQPKHAAQANPDRHFSPYVEFSVSEIITLYLSSPRRNMSAHISLRGLRRQIWVDTLRIVHDAGFLMERLNVYVLVL